MDLHRSATIGESRAKTNQMTWSKINFILKKQNYQAQLNSSILYEGRVILRIYDCWRRKKLLQRNLRGGGSFPFQTYIFNKNRKSLYSLNFLFGKVWAWVRIQMNNHSALQSSEGIRAWRLSGSKLSQNNFNSLGKNMKVLSALILSGKLNAQKLVPKFN